MTSMLDWAKLYGFNMTKVFHASNNLHLYNLQLPDHKITSASLLPQHRVI